MITNKQRREDLLLHAWRVYNAAGRPNHWCWIYLVLWACAGGKTAEIPQHMRQA